MDTTRSDPYLDGIWVKCEMCEDFWCMLHKEHVHDCDCPPLEKWIT